MVAATRTTLCVRPTRPTFSDATVRRAFGCPPDFSMSRLGQATIEIPTSLLDRFIETVCYAA